MKKPARQRSRSSPLSWVWRVRHAAGFRELGLLKEAERELKALSKKDAQRLEVLAEWTFLHQERGAWEKMAETAGRWAQGRKEEPAAWVAWAFSLRRAVSLAAAERILLEALMHHPHNATIHFNLGCYACQSGNLIQAQRRVAKAISLDATFKALAQTDPDLEPLRTASLGPV